MEYLLADPIVKEFLSHYHADQVLQVLISLLHYSIHTLDNQYPDLTQLQKWANDHINNDLKNELVAIYETLHKLDKMVSHTLKGHNIAPHHNKSNVAKITLFV